MEQKNNSGVLFKNERWTEGCKLPRYEGTATIDGVKKRVAVWVKTAKNGKPYMSLSFSDLKQ